MSNHAGFLIVRFKNFYGVAALQLIESNPLHWRNFAKGTTRFVHSAKRKLLDRERRRELLDADGLQWRGFDELQVYNEHDR